jgi:protoheme IX farnesyltransferase
LAIEAWKNRKASPRTWRIASILFGLFVIQVALGGVNVLTRMPILLRALHLGVAAAVWGAAIVLLAVLPRRARSGQEAEESAVPVARSGATRAASTLGKYVRLSKPWIIVLLLITTLLSMLIAGKGSAPLPLIVFTMLGGALASSGANAINSFIDRDIDIVMNRTKVRPIPKDQIAPKQALIFGLGASAASFVILTVFVNLLAAALSLFGIIYYVFVYTRWLKRTTPHNIVIGGIAGAVPPLVGWAAVTGRLDLLALYLFLIVFYWTPPHTWAMAILFRGDYERAGVPMLPVVRGEPETRRQIVLYSLQLVAITLLIFAFRLLGWVYLVLALALNVVFVWYAYRLTREMDKPAAKRLYKFSQVYLALLFAAMLIDASVLRG